MGLLMKLGLLAAAASLGGCQTTSVVRTSMAMDGSAAPPKGRPYYLYPLATTNFIITVKKAGGGKDDAKDDAKKDTTSNTATNTVTISVTSAEAKKKAIKDGKPPEEKKPSGEPCDFVRTAYKDLALTQVQAIIDHAVDLAALKSIADISNPLATLPQQDKAIATVKIYNDHLVTDRKTIAEANSLAKLFGKAKCATPIAVDISEEIIGDQENQMILYVEDDAFSADKITVKFDDRGFPTLLTSSADDKTGEVATAALKSIASVIGYVTGSPGGVAGGLPTQLPGIPSAAVVDTLPPAAAMNFALKSMTKTPRRKPRRVAVDEATFRKELNSRIEIAELNPPPYLKPLEAVLPTHPIKILMAELQQDATWKWKNIYAPNSEEVGSQDHLPKYFVGVRCSPGPVMSRERPSTAPAHPVDPETGFAGLVVSSPRNCELRVAQALDEELAAVVPIEELLSRSFVVAPDSRGHMVVPVSRTTLIARTDSYELKDGRITAFTYDKPSSALQVASWPFNAVGGIISGLSTSIQGKQSLVKAQADLVSAQASVTSAQASVINAQASVYAAQTGFLKAKIDSEAAAAAAKKPATAPPNN